MTRGSLLGPFRNAVCVGLECSRGMERTVQVLAAHCALKQSSDILASPGTMLAPALSTDRKQQKQHILTPVSAKSTPAQRHAHTHTHAHTYTNTCTPAHTLTRTHAYARTRCTCDGLHQMFNVASNAPTLILQTL